MTKIVKNVTFFDYRLSNDYGKPPTIKKHSDYRLLRKLYRLSGSRGIERNGEDTEKKEVGGASKIALKSA